MYKLKGLTQKQLDYIDSCKDELENLIETAATDNETVYDKYGNKITVPKGFKIVTPEEDSTVVYAYDKECGKRR